MFKRLPAIGTPITIGDIWGGILGAFDGRGLSAMERQMRELSGARHIFFAGSGIASFYLILRALKKTAGPEKNEVLLPAYTAPSLVVAVKKAALTPVLCDISLGDFNADRDDLLRRVNRKTLCVVCVHMFGIPFGGLLGLRDALPKDVFIVEDCAQAFGSRINGQAVGASSDAAFYSFNRGKNLPTYDGGCVAVSHETLRDALEKEAALLVAPSFLKQFSCVIKCAALFLAFRPFFYSLLYPLIARFKDNEVPADFELMRYTFFQAAFGSALLKNSAQAFSRRRQNGFFLSDALEETQGLIVPKIFSGMEPVFCRFPLLVKDKAKVGEVLRRLSEKGIESSRLYLRPLHHIFDLGYRDDEFPNAAYLADRLLTLPVHPYVEKRDVEMMAEIIQNALK